MSSKEAYIVLFIVLSCVIVALLAIGMDLADGTGAWARMLCGPKELPLDIRVGILELPSTSDLGFHR